MHLFAVHDLRHHQHHAPIPVPVPVDHGQLHGAAHQPHTRDSDASAQLRHDPHGEPAHNLSGRGLISEHRDRAATTVGRTWHLCALWHPVTHAYAIPDCACNLTTVFFGKRVRMQRLDPWTCLPHHSAH